MACRHYSTSLRVIRAGTCEWVGDHHRAQTVVALLLNPVVQGEAGPDTWSSLILFPPFSSLIVFHCCVHKPSPLPITHSPPPSHSRQISLQAVLLSPSRSSSSPSTLHTKCICSLCQLFPFHFLHMSDSPAHFSRLLTSFLERLSHPNFLTCLIMASANLCLK